MSDAFKLSGTAVILGGAGIAASLAGFAGFQQNLNLLQATAHATDAQMVAVSKTAVALGADLTLPATSAADAARAMTALARGGLSAVDAMNAAKGSLQLAAAANVDVAESSLIVAKNLNAFHLAGTDATKVVDILTNAYTKSGTPLSEFATGLANVSAVAHINGVSLQDTATAMAILTKNGVDASTAGTELRAVLLRLAAPTGPAAEELKKLGINIFNAKGQMLPFRDVVDLLSKSTKNLSQQQQDQAFKQIFGNRAIGEALILAQNGVAGFDAMAASIGKSGSAADIAGARMKGLSGTLEGIKSQIETVGISFGQVLAPAAQGVLNVLVTQSARLTDFSSAVAAALTPAVVTQYTDILTVGLHRVGAAFDGIQGPAIGAGAAIGSIFASQIPIIGAFVPEISVVSGVLFGIVAQSDKARNALFGFGSTLAGIGRDQAPAVIGALREINAVAGPAFAALFDGASRAAVILGPVLGSAIKDLAPPLAAVIESGGRFAGVILPELAQGVAVAARVVTVVLVPGLGLVNDGLGLLTRNAQLVVPILAGLAAVRLTSFVTEFVGGIGVVKNFSAAISVAQASNDSWAKSFGVLPAQASKLGALGETARGVGNSFLALNPLVIGAAVGVAVLAKTFVDSAKHAAEMKAQVDSLTKALSQVNPEAGLLAFIQQAELDIPHLAATMREAGLSTDQLRSALIQGGPQLKDFRDGLSRVADANGVSLRGQLDLANAIDALGGNYKIAATKVDDYSRVNKTAGSVTEDTTAKIREQTLSLTDLFNATLASIDANIQIARNQSDAKRSAEDLGTAQADLLKVFADPNRTQEQVIDTQRRFEDANSRVSDSLRIAGASAADAAQKQAVLDGKSKDSVDTFAVYKQGVLDAAGANQTLIEKSAGVIDQFSKTAAKAKPAGVAVGAQITEGIAAGLGAGTLQDIAAMSTLASQLADPAVIAAARAQAEAVGRASAAGVAAGIGLGTPGAVSAMQSLAAAVIAASKEQLIIKSPSKKAADEIGMPLAQGVAVGILAAIPESVAAGRSVIAAVVKGMVQTKAQVVDELKSIGDQIQAKVAEIRGTSQSLADAARVNAGVAAAIPFPELIALEVAKRVKDAQNKSTSDSIEQTIQQSVNAQLAAQGIAGSGAGAQDPKALFWISVNGEQQLFQGTEAQAIAKAKALGGLETPIIQGVNAPGDAEARNRAASDAASKAIADAATAAAHENQQLFNHQLISATQYLADLREQLGKLTPLTDDYFTVLDEITSVNKSITDAADQASRDQSTSLDAVLHREQLMYEHQMLAADAFLADLQGRMAQVTQYSDQWFSILDEIKKVQTEQATQVTGKTFLVRIDNNGQTLSEERLAELLARTARITPDHFASI